MPKRKRVNQPADSIDVETPEQSRRLDTNVADSPAATPSKVRSILRDTSGRGANDTNEDPTPKSLRRVLFSAPQTSPDANASPAPAPVKRKRGRPPKVRPPDDGIVVTGHKERESNGTAQNGGVPVPEKATLPARARENNFDEDTDGELETPSATPIKRGRGRPKGRRRERTPSPPPNLPPHELYFFHHRAGQGKTSANTLPPGLLLNHEDYFAAMNDYIDSHEQDVNMLASLHARSSSQWIFELEEGFNLCLYGYGSKRGLVADFIDQLHEYSGSKSKIIVVNGYTPGLTVRDILSALFGIVFSKQTKVPAQSAAALDSLISKLTQDPTIPHITLVIHSLDHTNLRKGSTQSLLSRLAAHPKISIIATCDNPNFPLLWDASHQRQFRWLYHDVTTFAPFSAELDAVEDVNVLLGRSTRRVGGKDGVAYVLRSLPDNAQALFKMLVNQQLALDGDVGVDFNAEEAEDGSDIEEILGAQDEEDAAAQQNTPSRRGRKKQAKPRTKASTKLPAVEGVEYRMLYHKAVEEFVCSSEVSFRTLLKEFRDHQMIESRKDALGTERLIVPFRREDLQGILDELS